MDAERVVRYLHACNAARRRVRFREIRAEAGRVHARVWRDAAPYECDYLDPDPSVRRLCTTLAEDLTATLGRAAFFTLEAGALCVFA